MGIGIELADMVGKTIQSIEYANGFGSYLDQPATKVIFTDGTFHIFVHPSDSD